MYKKYEFESNRLGFRLWCNEVSVPFSRMNTDNKVMQYFPSVLNKEESDKFIERIIDHFKDYGFNILGLNDIF